MARTSGWGAGPLLHQICPKCGTARIVDNGVTQMN